MDINAVRATPVAVSVTTPPPARTTERNVERVATNSNGVEFSRSTDNFGIANPVRLNESDLTIARRLDRNTQREGEAASARLIDAAIENANRQLVNAYRRLEASVHEDTNRIMVSVIDTYNDEVIREIPPEQTLDLFAKVLEMAGILFDERR